MNKAGGSPDIFGRGKRPGRWGKQGVAIHLCKDMSSLVVRGIG